MASEIATVDDDGTFTIDTERVTTIIDDEDMMYDSDFTEQYDVGERVLEVSLATGRDWESEETEKGHTIRTTPDPTIWVYERPNGGHFVLLVITGPNIIFRGFTLQGDLPAFLRAITESIEHGYDGITNFTRNEHEDGYSDAMDAVVDYVIDLREANGLVN